MQYLIKKRKPKVYHIFYEDEDDTACNMYSTGGLKKDLHIKTDDVQGLRRCQICNNKKRHEPVDFRELATILYRHIVDINGMTKDEKIKAKASEAISIAKNWNR